RWHISSRHSRAPHHCSNPLRRNREVHPPDLIASDYLAGPLVPVSCSRVRETVYATSKVCGRAGQRVLVTDGSRVGAWLRRPTYVHQHPADRRSQRGGRSIAADLLLSAA